MQAARATFSQILDPIQRPAMTLPRGEGKWKLLRFLSSTSFTGPDFCEGRKEFLGEFKMFGQNNAVSIRHTEERRAKLVAKLKDIFGRRLVGCKPRDCEVD